VNEFFQKYNQTVFEELYALGFTDFYNNPSFDVHQGCEYPAGN
jgi:hypothetical protein